MWGPEGRWFEEGLNSKKGTRIEVFAWVGYAGTRL